MVQRLLAKRFVSSSPAHSYVSKCAEPLFIVGHGSARRSALLTFSRCFGDVPWWNYKVLQEPRPTKLQLHHLVRSIR
jgi:hypothetical protein